MNTDRPWRRRWIQQPDGTLIEAQPDASSGQRAPGTPRLRPISEIKKRVTGDIGKLNARLLVVCRRLERIGKKHRAIRTVPGSIVISLFRKAVNTFEAIELLKRKRLIEESWVLLRVLLEAHVNLVYFLTHDPKDMVVRYLDASMLDKLKHLREVNFYEGTSMASHIYEEKVDGWRMLGYKDGERVRLVSRNGRDHTRRFGNITAAIAKLSARSLMLDGEVVTYDQQLRSASTGCANRSPNAVASPPLPMAFVLLYQDRRDLTGRALRDRRARLEVTWPAAN